MEHHVAIVDDDIMNLKIATNILTKNGIEVASFASGPELLDYLRNETPDLILLDILMPGMDGFTTLEKIHEIEEELDLQEIPVIFLTSEDDNQTETMSFEKGVSDYIRKPFEPSVLLRRITNILKRQEQLYRFYEEATMDNLTGLLNRSALSSKLEMVCRRKPGYLMMIDMDSFKLVNDIHGHKAGDKILISFAILIRGFLGPDDIVGRLGGDEFVAFSSFLKNENDLKEFADNLNENLLLDANRILGEGHGIKLGVSIGAIRLHGEGEEYNDVLNKADKALYRTKNNGKHGYSLYEEEEVSEGRLAKEMRSLSRIMSERKMDDKLWVAVVDDDAMNLKLSERILSKSDINVSTISSGADLLTFIKTNSPDLILLDLNMPEMDGFETLEKLHAEVPESEDIPIVFLTSENDIGTEKQALSLGAKDFIRKPFIPEILTMRVRQTAELHRLQKHLADEVDKKTKENELLLLHVVSSLAGAIDAKDTYTNGHSSRVAEYSKEIARRHGYNTQEQTDIYIMGLLHDVGKIGVPDSVINKPGALTEEEFESIKRHPVIGSHILKKIKEMPKLSVGARWHHERYDGTGYPDGLSGKEIPEEARIIAVADAYDAMSSKRSYRSVMSQEKIRSEIVNGKGTQFDPEFADIMLQMMDADIDFDMREK